MFQKFSLSKVPRQARIRVLPRPLPFETFHGFGHQVWQQANRPASPKRSRSAVPAQMGHSHKPSSVQEDRTVFKPVQASHPGRKPPRATPSANVANHEDDRTVFNPAQARTNSAPRTPAPKVPRDEDEERTVFNPIQKSLPATSPASTGPLPVASETGITPETGIQEEPVAIAPVQQPLPAAKSVPTMPLPEASIESSIETLIEEPVAVAPVQQPLPAAKSVPTMLLSGASIERSIQEEPAAIAPVQPSLLTSRSTPTELLPEASIESSIETFIEEPVAIEPVQQSLPSAKSTPVKQSFAPSTDQDDRTSFNPIPKATPAKEQTRMEHPRREAATD
ncbi:MAG: hypothetical protein HC866_23335, partial [Leptolyngbyaceae cyanobacterium RU_5_1]|nr:hypothetical protein [Leptolyngbyaceae cyanobacterium RU_5_1]